MEEQTLKFGELFPGTAAHEDPGQEALRIEVQDPQARYAARVRWSCAPNVSVDTHPVIAFCVKLGRPDLKFGVAWWRMDRYAEATALYEAPQSFWSFFPRMPLDYEPTTDWQLMIADGTEFENPNFEGNWTDLSLVLIQKDGSLRPGDCVWLKWAGVFPNKEAARSYFSAGAVFEEPTALFWHAESAPVVERPLFPVIPALSAKESARHITNCGGERQGKIPSERVLVAPYEEKASFCHHAGMAIFRGDLFVSWSSHEKDEDSAGQCVRVASSKDFYHWTSPRVVGHTRPGQYGETGLLCSHLFATDDALYLYCAEKEYYAACFREDGSFYYDHYNEDFGGAVIGLRLLRYQTADGVNWSGPEEVDKQQWTNESPRRSLTGRWFAGAGPKLAWTDRDDGFDLVNRGPSARQCQDALKRGAWMLTEASWYQTDDYIIHMLMRSNAGYLWMSESYDNGESWTDVYPTRFVADNTMPNFGRLPDGRYYFVGGPCWNNSRFPLALCLSDDGYSFDKMHIIRDEVYQIKRPGQAKEFQYAYPEVRIHDGCMYIAYSKGKEVMEVTRIKLSDI